MAKGEIANFEKYLLLSQCFQKLCAAEMLESICMWGKGYEGAWHEVNKNQIMKNDGYILPPEFEF